MSGDLLQSLKDLREEFADQMGRTGARLEQEFKDTSFNLPDLTIDFQVDLSALERYQAKRLQLESAQADLERDLSDVQLKKLENEADVVRVQEAKQKRNRIEERIHLLGPQPSPVVTTEHREKKVKDGGMWGSDEYTSVPVTTVDRGNIRRWEKELQELKDREAQQDEHVRQIMEEEADKRKRLISFEHAEKRFLDDLERRKKDLAKLEREENQTEAQLVAQTYQRLRKSTIFHVEGLIQVLGKNTSEAIERLFQSQLDALLGCVEEKYVEPLKTHQARLQDLEALIEEGDDAVRRRRSEVDSFLARLAELTQNTYYLSESVQNRL